MPTSTFTPGAQGDDGIMSASGPTYPPGGAPSADTTSALLQSNKELFAGDQYVDVSAIRWDTSVLPNNATVTQVDLKLEVTAWGNPDSRSFDIEWYAASNWPLTGADYTDAVATDAFSLALGGIASSGIVTFTLSNPTNVSLTGYTGLRLGISGTDAIGQNILQYASWDNTTNLLRPQLVVTYTVPPSVADVAWMGA